MSRERWKPVVGFEGLYEVSSHGRVRSADRQCGARNGGIAVRKGRVLKPVVKSNGYRCVTLTKLDARPQVAIHILVLEAFVGPRPRNAPHTRHVDGNQSNNCLSNLAWGDASDNARDRRTHGTDLRGERHHQAVLTTAQAKRIKYAISSAEAKKLAVRFGVSAYHGWAIHKGKTWKHI